MDATQFKSKDGLKRVYQAAIYSFKGFRSAYRHEAAFRQELLLVVLLLPVAVLLDITLVERILMISSLLLVLIVELLNSAIEAVVDRVGMELHRLSGRAKDLGSAAVFLSLLLVVYVWSCIIWNYIEVSTL
ncbi:MAG: diacylglycerol kinase [Cellvibrionaceae bacterium]